MVSSTEPRSGSFHLLSALSKVTQHFCNFLRALYTKYKYMLTSSALRAHTQPYKIPYIQVVLMVLRVSVLSFVYFCSTTVVCRIMTITPMFVYGRHTRPSVGEIHIRTPQSHALAPYTTIHLKPCWLPPPPFIAFRQQDVEVCSFNQPRNMSLCIEHMLENHFSGTENLFD